MTSSTLDMQLVRAGTPTLCTSAVIVKDGGVLLGLRNYTPDKWKEISVWTTPGGRSDEGESIEQALRREVVEEVNISALDIHDFIAELPGAKEGDTVLIFGCSTTENATLMEPEKFSGWKWVPIDEYLNGGPYREMNPGAHEKISEYLRTKN